jgi:hypothetical protein
MEIRGSLRNESYFPLMNIKIPIFSRLQTNGYPSNKNVPKDSRMSGKSKSGYKVKM